MRKRLHVLHARLNTSEQEAHTFVAISTTAHHEFTPRAQQRHRKVV
jgi:hypothetical protein